MPILEKLDLEIKTALKSRDEGRLSAVRLIKAAAKNREIELRHPLSEADFFSILQTLKKQRLESIEQFEKGGRHDLVAQEKNGLAIIQSFLPQGSSDTELEGVIVEAITATKATGPKDMGAVMKYLKDKTAGRVDNKIVSERVRAKLSSLS